MDKNQVAECPNQTKDDDGMGVSKEVTFDMHRNNNFYEVTNISSQVYLPKTLSEWGYKKLLSSEDCCILV